MTSPGQGAQDRESDPARAMHELSAPYGVTFGPYVLESELGRGTSGVVHRARDHTHGGRQVAVKIVDAAHSADPAFRERFHRDATRLGAVREPHLVPVHAVGEIGGRLYVDMRLVTGRSLADVLTGVPLAPARARHLAGQLAAVRESLRRAGWGERPLGAEDVLLTGDTWPTEFVQVVGLGLGRPPAGPGAVPPLERMLLLSVRRRRRAWPWVAAAVAVSVVAGGLVLLSMADPSSTGPAGLLATVPAAEGDWVAVDTVARGEHTILVAATADGAGTVWDLDAGAPAGPALHGPVESVAAYRDGDRAAAVVLDTDLSLRSVDLGTGEPIGAPVGPPAVSGGRADRPPGAVVVGEHDGRPVALARRPVERDDGWVTQVQAFTLPSGSPLGNPITQPLDTYLSGRLVTVAGRPATVAFVDLDPDLASTVAVVDTFDLRTGQRISRTGTIGPAAVSSLSVAVHGGVPLALVGDAGGSVTAWDLRSGEPVGSLRNGPPDPITDTALLDIDGRAVLLSTAGPPDDGVRDIRFRAYPSGELLAVVPAEHPLHPAITGVGEIDGRSVLFGTALDGALTVWAPSALLGVG